MLFGVLRVVTGVLPGCYWGVLIGVLLVVLLITVLQVCDKFVSLFVVFPSM